MFSLASTLTGIQVFQLCMLFTSTCILSLLQAIHEKILSINFKSVHAKIKQVDSHATLGEGIVIQVTGELSVNGQPMRAFVQTFVLAPESPKKYYVHNDIFRYQDDAYDVTSESENNEGLTEREQDVVQVTSYIS